MWVNPGTDRTRHAAIGGQLSAVSKAVASTSAIASGQGWQWLWQTRSGKAIRDVGGEPLRSPKLARVEAALFVTPSPLTERKLMQVATLADPAEARWLVEELNASYDATGSPFRVEKLATGYQLLTRREYAPWLDRIHNRQARPKLSPPMMETLVVIAYRQPVTRADIEAVRGVQCAEVIKQLLDRGFVRVAGEDDSLGRPFLYGTSRFFLENFGLKSLAELPMAEQLIRKSIAPAASDDDLSAAA